MIAPNVLTIADVQSQPDSKSISHRVLVAISSAPVSKTKTGGGEYLDVAIFDKTGTADMRIWDKVEASKERFTTGSIWELWVKKDTWQGKPQLTFTPGDSNMITSGPEHMSFDDPDQAEVLRRVSRIYELHFVGSLLKPFFSFRDDLINHGRSDLSAIFDEVFGIDSDVEAGASFIEEELYSEHYSVIFAESKLLPAMFNTEGGYELFQRYMTCPAAKGFHGAMIHGLAVHSLSILDMARAIFFSISSSPVARSTIGVGKSIGQAVDIRLVMLAALIHDYYKMEEYVWTNIGSIEYKRESSFPHEFKIFSDLQQMEKIEDKEFNKTLDKLSQVVLWHSGQYGEYQPNKKTPLYVETEIFHHLDMLDSRIVGAVEK